MQKTLSIAAVVLMAASLGACSNDSNGSSDNSDDYCSTLEDTKADIDNLDFTALTDEKFSDLQSRISDLEDAAPSEVEADWKTLGDGIDGFKKLLDDAGISFDDLQTLQSGEVPDGLDVQALQELGPKMQEIVSDNDIEAATQSIQDHAESECDLTLEESTGP